MIGDDEEVMLDQSLDSPTRRVQPVVRVQVSGDIDRNTTTTATTTTTTTSNTTPSTTTITTTTPTRRTPASMVPPSSARHRRVLNRGGQETFVSSWSCFEQIDRLYRKFVILWK